MKNMKDGVAVITGGGSGLGKAMAEEAARRGMRVVIADVQADTMNAAVEELRKNGAEAIGVLTDLTSADCAIERTPCAGALPGSTWIRRGG